MKKLKTQKGITLVALIITIVVLLILAAVAIGAVRNSDIIGHAQNAAGSFNQAKANEIGYLTGYEETINKYVPSENKAKAYFNEDKSHALIILADNKCLAIEDGDQIECTYISAKNINELEGYTLNDPNNIAYSEVIFIFIGGEARIGGLISQDRRIFYQGEVSNKALSISNDYFILDESADISEYLK